MFCVFFYNHQECKFLLLLIHHDASWCCQPIGNPLAQKEIYLFWFAKNKGLDDEYGITQYLKKKYYYYVQPTHSPNLRAAHRIINIWESS